MSRGSTPPRINAWVEIVSDPYEPRSIASTFMPWRAINIAVAAPAHRAPTTRTSNLLQLNMILPPSGRGTTGLRQVLADRLRQVLGVQADAVDEVRPPPPLKPQAQGVKARFRGDPAVMDQFARRIEDRQLQPAIASGETIGPKHGADAACLQIDRCWSRLHDDRATCFRFGVRRASRIGKRIKPIEQPLQRCLRFRDGGGQIVPQRHLGAGGAIQSPGKADATGLQRAKVNGAAVGTADQLERRLAAGAFQVANRHCGFIEYAGLLQPVPDVLPAIPPWQSCMPAG